MKVTPTIHTKLSDLHVAIRSNASKEELLKQINELKKVIDEQMKAVADAAWKLANML